MSGKRYGYARRSVASDSYIDNLESQRRVLVECEQVLEDVGSEASWNRPGLNRLKVCTSNIAHEPPSGVRHRTSPLN